MIMNKECVNKLECRFPTLFKVMWISVVLWLLVSIANYFGHWFIQSRLDGFGMGVIFMFAISLIICFGRAILNQFKKEGALLLGSKAKTIASYSFMISFIVLLLYSMLDLCLSPDYNTDYTRNGSVTLIPGETIIKIVFNFIISAIVSVALVLSYGYIRICVMMFSGRIRRIWIEIALAVFLIVSLSHYINDQPWINILVVLLATIFLYDIWQLADFKEEHVFGDVIKKYDKEDD